MWIAGFPGNARPMRRAARYDGFFPVNLTHPDQVAEIAATLKTERADPAAPYDLIVALEPDTDPAPYEAAGATWRLIDVDPEALDLENLRSVVRAGPG